MSFVERHQLWSDAAFEAAAAIEKSIKEHDLEVVRFSFVDQHGVLRGKTIVAAEAPSVLRQGCAVTTTLLAKDTANRTVFPVFTSGGGFGMAEMEGAADFLMIADPTTFRVLPWAERTGWALCDIHFRDGRPVPFSTRQLLRDQLARLAQAGFDYMAGLEVEFHLFKLLNPRLAPSDATWPPEPPEVGLLSRGFQLLHEAASDQIEPAVALIRRDVMRLGLPLRSVEVELGPSQCEFTFAPQMGLGAADSMVLFRCAVKQIARRHGLHATFMCRPRLANAFSSGWHLHQSLLGAKSRANAFASEDGTHVLSRLGTSFLAGLLTHARAAAAFTTPTINGYKRYRPYQLAPDRAIWGHDNRGVMVRVLGAPGDPSTHLENRVGDPAANPYLYMASQIIAGLDGVDHAREPGAPADTPYETAAELLPTSLKEALDALRDSTCFRAALGDAFVDYYLRIKEAEIARFHAEVTEWEQKEYFDLF